MLTPCLCRCAAGVTDRHQQSPSRVPVRERLRGRPSPFPATLPADSAADAGRTRRTPIPPSLPRRADSSKTTATRTRKPVPPPYGTAASLLHRHQRAVHAFGQRQTALCTFPFRPFSVSERPPKPSFRRAGTHAKDFFRFPPLTSRRRDLCKKGQRDSPRRI